MVFVRGSKSTSCMCAGRKLLGFNVWVEIDFFFVCEAKMICYSVGIDLLGFCVRGRN